MRAQCITVLGLAAVLLLSGALAVRSQDLPQYSLTKPRNVAIRAGSPIFIRIFKEESQLELWTQVAGRFELLKTYQICFWSGTLGPKQFEGDRQAPEGFYTVGPDQLIVSTRRHPRSLDIGFPNTFDRSLGRTGSHILLHGGCRSIGCFAMTDAAMDQIYGFAEEALRAGQREIQVHIFPFRMTEANIRRHANSSWSSFWSNLKQGYDAFEDTRTAPILVACGGAYRLAHDIDGPQAAPPPECGVSVGRVAHATARGRAIAQTWASRPSTPLMAAPSRVRPRPAQATVPVALPRDNVAECIRLWRAETRLSKRDWQGICKILDFQPKRALRTAHRPP